MFLNRLAKHRIFGCKKIPCDVSYDEYIILPDAFIFHYFFWSVQKNGI